MPNYVHINVKDMKIYYVKPFYVHVMFKKCQGRVKNMLTREQK